MHVHAQRRHGGGNISLILLYLEYLTMQAFGPLSKFEGSSYVNMETLLP